MADIAAEPARAESIRQIAIGPRLRCARRAVCYAAKRWTTVDEIPDQIGERLRLARENAGLAVEDVVFQTRLPRSAVIALEGEDFSHFISPVYAKSFLAQYSEYLSVDAGPWLDALKPSSFIEGDALLPLLDHVTPPPADHHHHHHHHHNSHHGHHGESDGSHWFSTMWMVILSAGLIFAAIKAYQFYDARFGAEPPQAREVEKPAAPEQNPAPAARSAVPAATPAAEAEVPENPKEEETVRRPPRAIIVR